MCVLFQRSRQLKIDLRKDGYEQIEEEDIADNEVHCQHELDRQHVVRAVRTVAVDFPLDTRLTTWPNGVSFRSEQTPGFISCVKTKN